MPITPQTAHPRLWFTGSGAGSRLNQGQTWWNTNKFDPVNGDAFGYAMCYLFGGGPTVTAATALGVIRAYFFGEAAADVSTDLSSTPGNAWLMHFAYQGTINGSDFVAVGMWASELQSDHNGSDHFRWGDWAVPAFDWCFAGWTTAEKSKFMNGWTTTWPVNDAYHGQTVTVPGYTTLVKSIRKQQWGGQGTPVSVNDPAMPGSNYFWGNFRNAVEYALAIWSEDSTNATDIYNKAVDDATNSQWAKVVPYTNSTGTGVAVGGVPPEGAGYGVHYMLGYPTIAFASLAAAGRDLYTESSFWKDALTALIYQMSPSAMGGDASSTYYQYFPWDDVEQTSQDGYPPAQSFAADNGQSFYVGDWLTGLMLEYPTATTGKYARWWFNNIGPARSPWASAVDPGGTAQDWHGDSLARVYHATGLDTYVARSGSSPWGSSASVLFVQLREDLTQATFGHAHGDMGCLQILRKDAWLIKEGSGYSTYFAAPRLLSTVSSATSSTVFAGTNLPTSSGFFDGTYRVKFLTGALAGQVKTISSYTGSTGTITMSSGFTATPAAGDVFAVYPWTGSPGRLADPGDTTCHNTPMIATFPGCPGFTTQSGQPTVSFKDDSTNYLALGVDLTASFKGGDLVGHPERDNPYLKVLVREIYQLHRLECTVILDRVQVQTVSGLYATTGFPDWAANYIPVSFPFHVLNNPTLNAHDVSAAAGTQTIRVFTLRPASPKYVAVLTSDFDPTVGQESDLQMYYYRVEAFDLTTGSDTHYLINVIQARDTTDSDVSASITAEDSNHWTVVLTHATKGSATVTLNKGLVASEGTVVVS